jgi:molybdate transport system regulatory protein
LVAPARWHDVTIEREKAGKAGRDRKETIMKISARNQIKGTVKTIREGAVNAVVVICRGNHNPVKADITMESVKALGLEEGKECYAVVKATNVMFASQKLEGISARNQIEGKVVKVQEGAVNGHVTIEDADGVQVTGSITNEAIEALGLKEGATAVAIIKATDVMVAVD